ncbi:MAG: hypothetical protein WCS97_02140 [Candidatus Paceibacterota bacterium]|jgi:hypothetical protein
MTKREKNSLHTVKQAIKKIGCTPQEFFERAVAEKTTPRNFSLSTEVENFFRLERGKGIKIPHEIPRVIVAHAEEINLQKDYSARFSHLHPSIIMARVSSGRVTSGISA